MQLRHMRLSLSLGLTLMLASLATVNASPMSEEPRYSQVTFKSGSVTLTDDSQIKSGDFFTYDEDSMRAFSFEGGARPSTAGDLAIGAEFLYFSHDWVSTAPDSGELDTGAILVNVKHYFSIQDRIWPFIGAGVGVAGAQLQRDSGRDSEGLGFAYQAMVGVQLDLTKELFIYAEAKALKSTITNIFSTNIDVSNRGVFVGIGFAD